MDNVTLAAEPLPPKPGLTTLSLELVPFHPEVVPPSKVPLGSRFVAAATATAGVRAMAVPTESTAAPAAQRINQDT